MIRNVRAPLGYLKRCLVDAGTRLALDGRKLFVWAFELDESIRSVRIFQNEVRFNVALSERRSSRWVGPSRFRNRLCIDVEKNRMFLDE